MRRSVIALLLVSVVSLVTRQALAERAIDWSTIVQALPNQHVIDECCCTVMTVRHANARLNKLLNRLVSYPFFRYFRVRLDLECPFWASETMCDLSGGCAVCECDEDDVPLPWRDEVTDAVTTTAPSESGWTDSLVPIRWWQCDVSDSDSASTDTASTAASTSRYSIVDLGAHVEANTGYRDGNIVWNAVHDHNCFAEPQCLEHHTFNKLISGLHTSVTTHVARRWSLNEGSSPRLDSSWTPNLFMFQEDILMHPERVDNLYFVYLVMLRAMDRLRPLLVDWSFDTSDGSETYARDEREVLDEIFTTDILCAPNFDERRLFLGEGEEAVQIQDQMRLHFCNITRMMDCVSCEKCKTFGKLQLLGVGTALRVLMATGAEEGLELPNLERNDIVAFVYTLRQLSNSITFISELEAKLTRARQTAKAKSIEESFERMKSEL